MTQPVALPSAAAQQQAAVEVFAQYEPPLYEAYLEMMIEWLAAVKTAMFAGGIVSLGLVPDPMTVFSQTPKWDALTERYSEKVARDVLAAPYRDLFADGTVFESRPFVRNWIAARANRLQQVPNEVFGAVTHIIDSATTNGASIPDVQQQIEQLFSDTGMATWKNRARTVARTEVVGAYNGGMNDAFAMIVEADPGTEYVKRWLATEDSRTRPDHVEADGQVVPFGQAFNVGGFQMMYPHDPDGPPQEVINCRCTMLLEIKNEPTEMGNRQYKDGFTASSGFTGLSLMQAVCDHGQFCMQTHKPGLCKGQKRGQTEPGRVDPTKSTPVGRAKVAVKGLGEAIARAQAIAAVEAKRNPKLAALARKAAADYKRALAPHEQTLKGADAESKRTRGEADRDAREQDSLDRRATRKKESLKKHAEAIVRRRKEKAAEAAKLKKMTRKQRAAYHKAKAAAARKKREQQENKVIKDASK